MNEKEKVLISKYQAIKKRKRIRVMILLLSFVVVGSSIFIVMKLLSPTLSPTTNVRTIVKKTKDTEKPLLELSVSEISIHQGESIAYDSYIKRAEDKSDGNLVKNVTYNKVDTTVPGDYKIIYTVKDKAKNEATAMLVVHITEKKQEQVEPNVEDDEEIQQTVPNVTPPPDILPAEPTVPNTLYPILFSSQEYGSTDGAMNACYEYMNRNGGTCLPVRNNQSGEWQGYQYTP